MRGRAAARLVGLALSLLVVAAPGRARGGDKATRLRDFPCAGCVTDLPPGESAVPLVVALHGDEGTPLPVALPRWARAAELEGYALLAPRCPRDRGCRDGSWWRWAGDPSWITEQIEKVRARRPLGPIYVVGWSGGSSYLGSVAPQWAGIDGVALCGGGMPPSSAERCAACPPPVYFVAGSGNPLHNLELSSRDYLQACQHEIRWDFLPGKDHGGELESLTTERTRGILAWLRDHRRTCAAPPSSSAPALASSASPAASLAASLASSSAGVGSSSPDLASADPPPPEAASMRPPPSARPSRCACGLPGRGRGGEGSASAAGIALLIVAARRRAR